MELMLPGRDPLSLDRPKIMGVLNLTPDSFSDGGLHQNADAALSQAVRMANEGADIIDLGGESTRPGARRVGVEEQKRRVLDILSRIRQELDRSRPEVILSIDTTRVAVAAAALDAGASILNDVSAGRDDLSMFQLAAERRVPIVLMHLQGEPETMQDKPSYENVVHQVESFLIERAEAAQRVGVSPSQIVIDPGIGFGKSLEHNLALLGAIGRFASARYPILLGTSRKRFIGQISSDIDPVDRVGGTCATTALGVAAGVRLFRVHDVVENRQAADVAFAIHAVV